MTREQTERRLAELRKELLAGQKSIAELEAKLGELRNTVQRISGAIQVLEQMQAEEKG